MVAHRFYMGQKCVIVSEELKAISAALHSDKKKVDNVFTSRTLQSGHHVCFE